MEYAIPRELGQPDVPVLTTIHPLQVVSRFPKNPTDLPLHALFLPEEQAEIRPAPKAPSGLDWHALTEESRGAMPVLQQLHESRPGGSA